MKSYHNTAVLKFDDASTGNAASGATVTVRINSTQALASIFNLSSVAIGNPMNTDTNGNYVFKAADGVYDIIVSEGTGNEVKLEKVQISEFIGLINDLSQAYEFTNLNQAINFNGLIEGKVAHMKAGYNGLSTTYDAVLSSSVDANTYNKIESASVPALSLIERQEYLKTRGGIAGKLTSKLTANVEDCFMYVQSDSTGVSNNAWVYKTANYLAAQNPLYSVKYYLWNDVTLDYSAAVTLQTGTGSKTLYIYNAAASGQNAYYFQALNKINMFAGRTFDFIMHSCSLNGDILNLNDLAFYDYQYAGLSMLRQDQKSAEICIVLQNFRTDHETYCEITMQQNQIIAARLGFQLVDIYSVFKWKQQNGNIADWMQDTTHPSPLGYTLWSDIVNAQFSDHKKQKTTNIDKLSTVSDCVLRDPFLIDWAWDASAPKGVTATDVTLSKELTIKETGSYSVKAVSTSGTNGVVQWNAVSYLENLTPDSDLTLMIRMYVPNTNTGGLASRLYASTNIGNVTTSNESSARDGWLWKTITIPWALLDGATSLFLIVYMGATNETAYIDRVNLMQDQILKNPKYQNLALADYYFPTNVRATATNVLTVAGNDVTIDSSSEVSPTPSIDLDVYNLSMGAAYKVTWTTSATNNTFAKDGAGGGSTVIKQVTTNSGVVEFTALSSSATIRFFVTAAEVPVAINDIKITKLYIAE